MSPMLPFLAAAAVISIFVRRYYRWLTFNSIKYVRGPPANSLTGMQFSLSAFLFTVNPFCTGHLRDVALQESVGDLDFKWMKEYGTAWRLKGPLGVRDSSDARRQIASY